MVAARLDLSDRDMGVLLECVNAENRKFSMGIRLLGRWRRERA